MRRVRLQDILVGVPEIRIRHEEIGTTMELSRRIRSELHGALHDLAGGFFRHALQETRLPIKQQFHSLILELYVAHLHRFDRKDIVLAATAAVHCRDGLCRHFIDLSQVTDHFLPGLRQWIEQNDFPSLMIIHADWYLLRQLLVAVSIRFGQHIDGIRLAADGGRERLDGKALQARRIRD
ncbi:hypothetical protein ALC53_01436 [Atta colombica]|uniref:Uncharacterized protein n=1 Tax=Atta colombica TaxID=520822 RepID=A0A195BVL3_9HYME|nr:hypothetical protein ALC53_01436 [Atta colombica]